MLLNVISVEQFNEANRQHVANVGALLELLLDKQVIDADEYTRAHARALAAADQQFAAAQDQYARNLMKHDG